MKRFAQIAILGVALWGISGCGEAINDALKNTVFDANTTYTIADSASVDSPNEVVTDIIVLTKITLLINLDHNRTGDLKMVLINPDGLEVTLVNHRGNDHNISGLLMFSETETRTVMDADFPESGVYRPEANLSVFHGNNPNGTWHLKITDDVNNSKEGTLNAWILTINGTR